MARRVDDIIHLCCEISENYGIKDTWRNSFRAAQVAGAGTLFRGLLLGVSGILVVGAAGVVLAWLTSKEFKPVPQVLRELPSAQKQRLYNEIVAILGNPSWRDVADLIAHVKGNAAVQKRAVGVLCNFITKELKKETDLKSK